MTMGMDREDDLSEAVDEVLLVAEEIGTGPEVHTEHGISTITKVAIAAETRLHQEVRHPLDESQEESNAIHAKNLDTWLRNAGAAAEGEEIFAGTLEEIEDAELTSI